MPKSFFARFKLSGGVYRQGVVISLLVFVFALAACGGTPTTTSNSSNLSSQPTTNQPASTPGTGGTGTGGTPTLPNGTPTTAYLIRTLSVNLLINQPLDAESQITQEVLSKDPQAQTAGEQINQQSDGSYTVALTFAISAAKYSDIKAYLGTFPATHPTYKGKLISENETVQNVTDRTQGTPRHCNGRGEAGLFLGLEPDFRVCWSQKE